MSGRALPRILPRIPPLPPPSCPLPLRACPCPSPSGSLFLATACAPSNSRPLQSSPLLHTRIQYLFVRFAGSCSSGGTAAWPEAQEGQLSALALRRRGALVFRAEYFFRSVWGPAVVGKAVATVRPRLLPRLALAESVYALRRSALACRALPCPIQNGDLADSLYTAKAQTLLSSPCASSVRLGGSDGNPGLGGRTPTAQAQG